jgi:hypothetical protein
LLPSGIERRPEHVPDLRGAGQGRNQLGLLYLDGRGVPLDYVQAYFWFSLSGFDVNIAYTKTHLSAAVVFQIEN